MKFVQITMNGDFGKAEWEIHAAGCRDIARTRRKLPFGGDVFEFEADSAEAYVDAEVDYFEHVDQGWSHVDHYIHGCASQTGKGGHAVDGRSK